MVSIKLWERHTAHGFMDAKASLGPLPKRF